MRKTARPASAAARSASIFGERVGMAPPIRVVVVLALLFGFLSSLDVVTVAVFTSWPKDAVTCTWIAAVALAPGASEPRSNVTVPFCPTGGPVHVPWLDVQLTNTVPVGSGSVTVTARAVPGPALRTTIA